MYFHVAGSAYLQENVCAVFALQSSARWSECESALCPHDYDIVQKLFVCLTFWHSLTPPKIPIMITITVATDIFALIRRSTSSVTHDFCPISKRLVMSKTLSSRSLGAWLSLVQKASASYLYLGKTPVGKISDCL